MGDKEDKEEKLISKWENFDTSGASSLEALLINIMGICLADTEMK